MIMKKIITLISVALCAISINAQGNYILADADAVGTDVTSVNGITLSYSAEGTWTNAAKRANNADTDFTAYTSGNGVSGSFVAGSVPTGCFYKFTPTSDGTLLVGICLNTGKPLYIVKGSDFSALALSELTANLPDSKTLAPQTLGADYTIPVKSYGTVSFAVSANETYYVLCTGSKLGFYGFKYTTASPANINGVELSEKTDSPIYNVVGQQVNKSYKGLIIKDGKKYSNK